jgi:hypothetical protein
LVTTLLFTPPFTQLNTPYPATAYLKGFLDTKNISSYQADFGIEVLLQLFSKKGFTTIFENVIAQNIISDNAKRMYKLRQIYIDSINDTILYLQGNNSTLTHLAQWVCKIKPNILPLCI